MQGIVRRVRKREGAYPMKIQSEQKQTLVLLEASAEPHHQARQRIRVLQATDPRSKLFVQHAACAP